MKTDDAGAHDAQAKKIKPATRYAGYHKTIAAEVAAAETAPPRPAKEVWEDFERFGHIMQRAPFKFARTLAENPHGYVLRRNVVPDSDWCWAVLYTRSAGYTASFGGFLYRQIDLNEKFIWSMGFPLQWPKGGTDCTILLNSKVTPTGNAAYDPIGNGGFDTLFRGPEAQQDDATLYQMIERLGVGAIETLSVLDVGCGTGRFLRTCDPRRYVGIDPSDNLLRDFRYHHPQAAVVRTPLRSFCAAAGHTRYDLVVSLYGSGSYLSDSEISRIPLMLNTGGRAVTMFYAPGYTPETYKRTKSPPVPHRTWHAGLMEGEVLTDLIPNFVVVITRAEDQS